MSLASVHRVRTVRRLVGSNVSGVSQFCAEIRLLSTCTAGESGPSLWMVSHRGREYANSPINYHTSSISILEYDKGSRSIVNGRGLLEVTATTEPDRRDSFTLGWDWGTRSGLGSLQDRLVITVKYCPGLFAAHALIAYQVPTIVKPLGPGRCSSKARTLDRRYGDPITSSNERGTCRCRPLPPRSRRRCRRAGQRRLHPITLGVATGPP